MKLDTRNKRQMIKLHRELWGWLYENPKDEDGFFNEKSAWPRWADKEAGDIPTNHGDCFGCAYARAINDGNIHSCKKMCPLVWTSEEGDCLDDKPGDEKGLYLCWATAKTVKTKKKYAALIRDLQVKRMR